MTDPKLTTPNSKGFELNKVPQPDSNEKKQSPRNPFARTTIKPKL